MTTTTTTQEALAALEPLQEGQVYVILETTKGRIIMRLMEAWSPLGVDRLVRLLQADFYTESHFYRVIPNFLVQFGISYTEDQALLRLAKTPIQDDPPLVPPIVFEEGTISYAGSGRNSRTSQIFISYGRHASLGTQPWETPLGMVVSGMEAAHAFYSYGDGPPHGKGPGQPALHNQGKAYAEREFPKMDSILQTTVVTFAQQEAQAQQHEQQRMEQERQDRLEQQQVLVHGNSHKINTTKLLRRVHKQLHVDAWGTEPMAVVVMPLVVVVGLVLGFCTCLVRRRSQAHSKKS